jgi:hypothetical protein
MALSTTNASSAVQQLLFKLTSDGSMRGTVTPDKGAVFSVYDFITKACLKSDTAYARVTYGNLIKSGSEYCKEILQLVYSCKLPGSSGPPTPCTDIRGLQRLLTILDSKVSAEYRAILNDTFLRYMAGDLSMVKEIEANNASEAPTHLLARDALSRAAICAPAAGPANDANDAIDAIDDTLTISDSAPGMDAGDEERMRLVREVAANLKTQSVALTILSSEISEARKERDRERTLRHAADGRLGAETREANKNVREQAAFWRGEATELKKLAGEQRGWMRDMQTTHNDALRVANERYDEEKREGRANSVRLSEMHHVALKMAECLSKSK